MRYEFDFCLPLPDPSLRLTFWWDDKTGELCGENAEIVAAWADEAKENGFIYCGPLAGHIPATNPLHVKAEFCALIGYEQLPDSLKSAYPSRNYPGFERFDDMVIPDAINPKIDVQYWIIKEPCGEYLLYAEDGELLDGLKSCCMACHGVVLGGTNGGLFCPPRSAIPNHRKRLALSSPSLRLSGQVLTEFNGILWDLSG
ncbi:hypothetical protein QZJ86_11190 [Methylomonas montana]|uniref:hypothetical protein n=1 Tax=Methylomonas montana TaxID=3058963 RepID=UPI00265A4954|nr:hypothetical protein [Methylomonas montana]WKJ88590.1 hypothetical protein QZJ86_11190 [Methylomonas montana]